MPKVIDDKDVFRAAIDLLSTCGYESATTKNIADAAGIHEATLFRKYGSKFNLIEQAIKAQFVDVPLAKVAYTGDLQADLLSIIKAYLKTSEMVGNILPILLIEIPRNPELKNLLEIPWKNITRVTEHLGAIPSTTYDKTRTSITQHQRFVGATNGQTSNQAD